MLKVLLLILLAWALLAVVGFIIKGLLWLAVIGVVLFAATSLWGWARRGQDR